jgi:peptidoglycan DL-endopeptidase LytF
MNTKTKIAEVNNMSWNNSPEFLEYTIQSGDTIWDLADEFELSVDDILEANVDLDPESLAVGQTIYIPGDLGLNASQRPSGHGLRPDHRPGRRPRPYGCRRTYVVRPGDTLYRISYQFGIPVRSLMNANPYINFDYPLQVGQYICLPY